jgi:tetratricopeptide (TPR) repeat protein
VIAECDEALRRAPNDVARLLRRGEAHARRKAHQPALTDFTRAIELDSRNARAYYQRGLLRLHTKDYAGARKDLDEAVSLDPSLGEKGPKMR